MSRGPDLHDPLPLWRCEEAQHLFSSADFFCQSAPFFVFYICLRLSYSMTNERAQQPGTSEVEPDPPHNSNQLLEPDLARRCVQICTDLHAGNLEKPDAITKVISILYESSNCTGLDGEQAIKSYLQIIERAAGDTSSLPRADEAILQTEGDREELSRSDDEEDEASENGTVSDLDTSQLPWEIQDAFFPKQLSEELQKTNNILRLFARDYKKTKISLLTNPRRPEFPESEWDNIIRGRSIDLDKVLSGMAVVGADTKRVERLSSLVELRFGNVTPIKRVTTHGEWEMSWSRACSALEFVFAHRKSELQTYTEHMQRKFYATHVLYHDCILLYDRAVWERVSHHSDLSLTDTTLFDNLAVMHTTPTGSESTNHYSQTQTSITASRDKPEKSTEACRRFNSEQRPNTASTCMYRHICAVCRQSGHAAGDPKCNKKIKRE
ncbi:hypothetical protein M422DRAFT_776013 [Sphaerobolus stellatus SS14]|nr:hypothetical protein M422DRAFT_776013 [Sphaerobolus stellatus SS14]